MFYTQRRNRVFDFVEEDMYIHVPQDLEIPDEFKKEAPALRLLKELYGFKLAPRL